MHTFTSVLQTKPTQPKPSTRESDNFWWWEEISSRARTKWEVAEQTDDEEEPTGPPPFEPEPPVHSVRIH